ncbi:MAG TPA: helix-turn-helix transcriptional regulator, partial [Collinsella ihuae]|nr:helix-turn-helix transcriptional regulator [Collinsella ihumii]
MIMKNTLARLRRERGLTQEELARRLYITRQAVSRWETGATEPGIDMIKLIARELDVPITELLDMPEHYCQSCGMMFT